MRAIVEHITPDMAYEYLTQNTRNYRRVNARTVMKYAQTMKDGNWELNGEPIVFDTEGKLINGQHRLNAIVEAGIPVDILVVRGVDKGVVVFDDGRVRRSTDVASAMGFDMNTRILGAGNRIVAKEFDGGAFDRSDKRTIAEYCGKHLAEFKRARACTGTTTSISNRAWILALTYLLLRDGRDPSMISDFYTVCNTGMPIVGKESTSALVFRNMMYMNPTLNRKADEPANMHYLYLAIDDFQSGVRRRNTYANRAIITNQAEALWHKIRKEDGLE